MLVQTTLEPEKLQVVLNETVTRKSVFVSDMKVQKPVNGRPEYVNAESFLPTKEIELSEAEPVPYVPPTEPLVCNIGGG